MSSDRRHPAGTLAQLSTSILLPSISNTSILTSAWIGKSKYDARRWIERVRVIAKHREFLRHLYIRIT